MQHIHAARTLVPGSIRHTGDIAVSCWTPSNAVFSHGNIPGRAAQIAGLNRKEFLEALAREKVDVFVVDFDDLKRELELA
ncbi:MAG: UPF0175 family protein [Hormoscilla sp. GM102CHS1]|nr:UPF0175 family protein [Hormoscilla sp. GM102CHS1]